MNIYALVNNNPTNDYDVLGSSIEPVNINPDDLYLAPATKTPFDANEGGEAGIAWVFKAQADGNTLSVQGSLQLNPVIFPIADIGGAGLTYVDRFGNTTTQHERRHDAIAEKWWNQLVPVANDLEGHYKCPSCAKLAETVVNAFELYARESETAENFQFDLDAYASGEKYEAADVAGKAAAIARASNALANEKSVWQEFSSQNCKVDQ